MAITINGGTGVITGVSVGGLPDGIVDSGTLATNSVDSAELIDGSIDSSHLASGVEGAWKLIGTSVASNSANLSQTGLSSTYDTYAVVLSDIVPATDDKEVYLRVGDSAGYDSGASDYKYHLTAMDSTATGYSAVQSGGAAQIPITMPGVGSSTAEGMAGTIYIGSPSDGTLSTMIYGLCVSISAGADSYVNLVTGTHDAAIALDRVQIVMESAGNIESGRMSVYGISHS